MKKFWMIAASVLLLAACEKEAPVQQETPNNETPATDLVTYTFKASINATKAYIDDDGLASGATAPLKWSNGDKIALYNSTTEAYVEFSTTLDADATTATFTAEAPSGAVFTKAYYPADYRGEGLVTYYNAKFKSDNNPLMSLSDARKCVVMEVAEIAANATSINFSQKGSMVKFTVSNMPDFAGKATLTFGDLSETVAIASTDITDGTSVFYFPVPAGTHDMTFSLIDNATTPNTFYTKTRNNAKLGYVDTNTTEEPNWVETPSLHRYTVTLGPVVYVTKQSGKDYTPSKIHTWQKGDTDTDITTWSTRPSMFALNSSKLYYIYDKAYWNKQVGIKITAGTSDDGQQTNRVYLDRNITLTAGNKSDQLVGTYRIYALPRPEDYVMQSTDVLKVYSKAWPNNEETAVSSAWPGDAMTYSTTLGLYYWDFNEDYASWGNVGFEFYVAGDKRTGTYIVKDGKYVSQDLVFYFNLKGDDNWHLDYK